MAGYAAPMQPSVAFELQLEHGLCVAVLLPEAREAGYPPALDVLPGEELAAAAAMSPVRRRTWLGGRVAMRLALARAGIAAAPVLSDDRGAPLLPAGVAGSISHKESIAVALVAAQAEARLGIDVEADGARSLDISRKVLHPDELPEVATYAGADRDREVLLRFSAKEAIYKAIDPFVRRYVGFKEVSVSPRPDGTAEVRDHLGADAGRYSIEVRWRRLQGLVLTTARVRAI
jgi:4'-phosphopantetheinyl transferase EntD